MRTISGRRGLARTRLGRMGPGRGLDGLETIAKASPGGGHILASSNSLHPAVNPANYRAMVRTAREFGRYPLEQGFVEEYRAKAYAARFLDVRSL